MLHTLIINSFYVMYYTTLESVKAEATIIVLNESRLYIVFHKLILKDNIYNEGSQFLTHFVPIKWSLQIDVCCAAGASAVSFGRL